MANKNEMFLYRVYDESTDLWHNAFPAFNDAEAIRRVMSSMVHQPEGDYFVFPAQFHMKCVGSIRSDTAEPQKLEEGARYVTSFVEIKAALKAMLAEEGESDAHAA